MQPALRDASFEDLANITITTVARKAQRYLATPAAIHVLTQDDLASVGGLSTPDALRLAPGIQVGQINAHSWAITARGFASPFSDKLVVLVDNRSVYTPLWSGVYWEQREWLADELDRIEVVRGPGGSKWGTNAVNGAINIFTRSARDTQGLAALAAGGDEDRVVAAFRYGAPLGDSGWIRGYAGYRERDDSVLANGADAGDGWDMSRIGFRYDGELGDSELMLKGSVFSGDFNQRIDAPRPTAPFAERLRDGYSDGGHLHGSWTLQSSAESRITIQAFYDRSDRRLLASEEVRDTLDIEAQQQIRIAETHELTWGLGYRRSEDDIRNNFVVALIPSSRGLDLWSAFIEDEIAASDTLAVTLGAKFEHNDFTQWEVQPSARIAWRPDDAQTWWGAVSRAARHPNRINEDLIATNAVLPPNSFGPGSPVTLVQNLGGDDVESETVVAWETGWRTARDRHAIDIALFYNNYSRLIGFSAPMLDTVTLAPQFWRQVVIADNLGSGHTYGAELAIQWRPQRQWLLQAAYSWLALDLTPPIRQFTRIEGSSPRHMLTLRSSTTFGDAWRVDMALRYVDELPALDIPDYLTADINITRALVRNLEVILSARNLLDAQHPEFRAQSIPTPTEVERSAFFKLSWRTE